MSDAYKNYLKSDRWKSIRELVLMRDVDANGNPCCQKCGKKYVTLHVHHKSYRWLFREAENLSSLTLLCEPCHFNEHWKPVTWAELEERFKKL